MLVFLIVGIMKYVIEMALGVVIHRRSFMTVGLDIELVLRLLLQQFWRIQWCYY
jgi:hypothetical protein